MAKRVTTQEFIRRAKSVHGERYDYSSVEYKRIHEHVTIICKKHGPFNQSPANHYAGKGCSDCGGSKPHTKESFIEEAYKFHDDFYDYSDVEYTNNKAHVTINCPEHGPFEQIAKIHMKGNGCPSCGGCMRYNTESFIEKAMAVHGDKYDYSKVDYVDSHTPVIIICPIHGEFSQTPTGHFACKGCAECGKIAAGDARKDTTESFIEKARNVHGELYDYSLVDYVASSQKVIIICSNHGQFKQAPNEHLVGSGCNTCGFESAAEARRKDTEQFIQEAISVHGDRYDYSLVDYVRGNIKVSITCPVCGVFEQAPNGHVQGKGCSGCAESGFNPNEPAILYYVAVKTDDGQILYKIGITNLTVQERFAAKDLERIRIIKVWKFKRGEESRERESRILNQFSQDKYDGPGILRRGGNTELFTRDVLGLDTGKNNNKKSVIDANANLRLAMMQLDFDF